MRQFKPGQLQSGSLYPITASAAVTASYALNALTASYTLGLDTGSLVTTSSFNAFTASYATGSFTGSFKGDGSQLTGIVSSKWTGSNPISRESDVEITGSLRVQGSITGSLFGTASWANNAVTASYVVTAQTASYVLNAVSASYAASASQAVSSSFALTASFITASSVFGPYGANSVISSSNSVSSSFALTASYVTPLQQNVIITGSIYIPDNAHSIYFSGSNAASRLVWNDTDGTLDLGLKGGNVTLQIGQEQVVRVVNKTGANLLESGYKAVRIRRVDEGGSQGQRLAIVLAQANNDSNSVDTLGIVTENIDVNQEGFITNSGLVRGINTTGTLQGETWSDGDLLYLSPTTPGALTTTKPQAPDHTVIMGYVVYAHNNQGKIFVKVDNGYEIDELHNVRITTASLAAGQLLVRSGSNATGVWINTNQLTGSYGLTGSLTATQITASGLYAGPTYISGSLIVNGQSTFYGTASFVNVTASNLFVSESFISVNVFEPVERFGGLKVYDSGSSTATASLAWDSLHNHWVYQNVSGSTYTGGMLLSGPRNTGSLGDEPNLTKWFVPRSDGGDHLENSQIFTSGSITQITGSLTVTGGVTASLSGTASFATSASQAISASFASTSSHALESNTIIPLSGLGRSGLITFVSSTGSAAIVRAHQTFNVVIDNTPSATVNLTGSLIATSITSSLQGTASYAGTASYLDNYVPPFPYTGSASITGSLDITGSLELTGSQVYLKTNEFIVENVDVNVSLIEATTAGGVYIRSTDSNPSAVFENRIIYDANGQTSIDWGGRQLNDQNNNNIIDYAGAGNYSIRNFRPTIETLTLAVQDEFTQVGAFGLSTNAAGNIIDVATNIDLAVTASNPVFLDTDGIWKQTDQATNTTTKFLGICVEAYNKGQILTEGIITVTTSSGYGETTPFVSGSSFHGMPVYLTGSIATFTTDVPTSGYVRVIGHIYYNSTSNSDYWIMKFNPSNDWYEI